MSVIYLIGSRGFWQSRNKHGKSGRKRIDGVTACRLSIGGPVSELLDQQLKKIFIIRWTGVSRDAQPGGDHICNTLSVLLADFRRDIQAAGKKCLNQLGFLKREFGGLGYGEVRIGWRIEEQG